MKIQRRRPRFSIRALLLFTLVVALVLGYRQYVVFRIQEMNDGIRRAEIELQRLGGDKDDIIAEHIDRRFRSWLDFVLVIPPRMGYCQLHLTHLNNDTVLAILSSSGFTSIDYASWLLPKEYLEPDVNESTENAFDENDVGTKPPVPERFTYVASSTLDRLTKFKIKFLSCMAPVATEDMSKFNQIRGLEKLELSGNWITDAHLKLLQPSDSIRVLNIASENITEVGLTELIDRTPRPGIIGLGSSNNDPSSQRLHEYVKKREISNLNKQRR